MSAYNDLRKSSDERSQEETVGVNHRALITRTLSKYPVDFALFRELIQNSADAEASTCTITFKTDKNINLNNLELLPQTMANHVEIKNDGRSFAETDWKRLREIASGNPDENKIGAFGVGFYSVFAVTNEPLVVSGDSAMHFFYKGDQLHYRRSKLKQPISHTVIDLPYYRTCRLPNLLKFSQFLSQSLLFVKLIKIELYIDNVLFLQVNKFKTLSTPVNIPKNINLYSLDKILYMEKVISDSVQLKIKYIKAVKLQSSDENIFSKGFKLLSNIINKEDWASYNDDNIFLKSLSSENQVLISRSFAETLKSVLMKPPPKRVIIQMLIRSASEDSASNLSDVTSSIFPKLYSDGRLFIGFPTKQSSGLKTHFHVAHAIPTMERAAVDMSNSVVKDWNIQMMYQAGILARIGYEFEMNDISKQPFSSENYPLLAQNVDYIMDFFSINPSYPDLSVGLCISKGFWESSKFLPVLTNKGICLSNKARIKDDVQFLTNTPLIETSIFKLGKKFIENGEKYRKFKPVEFDDIFKELSEKPLNQSNTLHFIEWCISLCKKDENYIGEVQNALNTAIGTNTDESPIVFAEISYYLDSSVIPGDIPIPPNCLPAAVSGKFKSIDLNMLGWRRLNIIPWIKFIFSANYTNNASAENNPMLSPELSLKILKIISRYWTQFSEEQQNIITNQVSTVSFIPTHKGMKLPKETYLEAIKLFPDLPIFSGNISDLNENMLLAIGVRKTIELRLVLKELHSNENNNWSIQALISYLVMQKEYLKQDDYENLRHSSMFNAENSSSLYTINQLYQPVEENRKMKLKVLQWDLWNSKSPEALFLFDLGLKKHPSISTWSKLITSAADSSESDYLLNYFIAHYNENGYRNNSILKNQNILPAICEGKKLLCTPAECFTNEELSCFSLPVLEKSLKLEGWKFGVKTDPSAEFLAQRLIKFPPLTQSVAEEQFKYMSVHFNDLPGRIVSILHNAKFVPIFKYTEVYFQQPSNLFIMEESATSIGSSEDIFYKDLFDFSSFSPIANIFLRKCGARSRPSIKEIAWSTVENPPKMLALAKTKTKYKELLLSLALNWEILEKDTQLLSKMKTTNFLLGVKYLTLDEKELSDNKDKDLDENIEDIDNYRDTEYLLAAPKEIVLVDDVITFNLFRKHLITSPVEKDFEKFYKRLGATYISNIKIERFILGDKCNNFDKSKKIKQFLLERMQLFMDSKQNSFRYKFSWFKQNFFVEIVESIKTMKSISYLGNVYSLPYQSITAHCVHNKNGKLILYVNEFPQWYDVSIAISNTVLKFPTPESVTVFESLLNSKLSFLERRGYNIDRILEQRKAEAKVLEEARNSIIESKSQISLPKHLDTENKIEYKNPEKNLISPENTNNHISNNIIPQYPNNESSSLLQSHSQDNLSATDNIRHQDNVISGRPETAKSIYSFHGLFDRFLNNRPEINNQNSQNNQNNQIVKNTSASLPVSVNSPNTGIRKTSETSNDEHSTVKDYDLIRAAIKKGKPFSQSNLQSKENLLPPTLNETSAEKMCDRTTSLNLKYLYSLPNGPRVFVTKDSNDLPDYLLVEIVKFRVVLWEVCCIYNCSWSDFHIFYDPTSPTIAFNSNGSLFFNLKYFLLNTHGALRDDIGIREKFDVEYAINYWFTTAAHELAHNIVAAHGQLHSYYSEVCIQQFLSSLISRLNIINKKQGAI